MVAYLCLRWHVLCPKLTTRGITVKFGTAAPTPKLRQYSSILVPKKQNTTTQLALLYRRVEQACIVGGAFENLETCAGNCKSVFYQQKSCFVKGNLFHTKMLKD